MKKDNLLFHQFFINNKLNLIMAIISTTFLSIAILLMPQLIQMLFDYLVGDSNIKLNIIIIFSISIIALEFISALLTYFFRTKFSTRATRQYRNYAYDLLLNKSVTDFYKVNTSLYLSSLTNDLNRIKESYLDLIPIIYQIIICGVGAVAIMMRYDIILALIALAISLIPFVASLLSGKNMNKAEENLSNQNIKYLSHLKDYANGFPIIKSYKVENIFANIHKEQTSSVAKAMIYRERNYEKVNYFAAISSYITRFLVLFVCSYFAIKEKSISAGTVIAFYQLVMYIIDPFSELPPMIVEAKAAINLSHKFWSSINNKENVSNNKKNIVIDGSIKIENLSFYYSEEKNILNNINLSIKPGEKVAIIGSSGCGKTTLLKLVLGILKPTSGKVLMSNSNIQDIDTDMIFEQIAYIQQDVFIFDGTIKDNITLYQKYSDSQFNKAIKLSNLEELIKEKGKDYMCGENGNKLSGGEKQKIALARSILKKSKLLVADEITASLDNDSSYLIMNSILNIKDTTIISVLHHFDKRILEKFDSIYALKNGEIKESGSFDELIKKKGYFYSLYNINN